MGAAKPLETGSVIVLNGVPRSGKTSIVRAIQESFDGTWINLGVDSGRAITPEGLQPGIGLRPGGERSDLEPFVAASYSALFDSIVAAARAGLNVVVDVGLHEGYSRPLGLLGDLALRLDGIPALLVGVRCPTDVVVERRAAAPGTYESRTADGTPTDAVLRWEQAVHDPGRYDVEVDTSLSTPEECAEPIGHALEHGPTALDELRTELLDELIQLERGMWRTETRGDRAWMDDHLAPGFTEFGRSGRTYTRDDTLAIPVEPFTAELTDIDRRPIGADAVLVTYRSAIRGERANRASIWRRMHGRWRLEFHQGTPTP